jgi:hypothetical protein
MSGDGTGLKTSLGRPRKKPGNGGQERRSRSGWLGDGRSERGVSDALTAAWRITLASPRLLCFPARCLKSLI